MTPRPIVSPPTTLPPWLKQLRRTHVTDRLNSDPRSVAGTILGIDPEVAMREVAGWGQADFDEPWGALSPADRTLIYSHFFQLGHLEELTSAFRLLFPNPPTNPIVVDLGCGPFTGGLALAAVLGPTSPLEYIGVDQSHAMRDFGERLATVSFELPGEPTDSPPLGSRHILRSLVFRPWLANGDRNRILSPRESDSRPHPAR